MELDPKLKEEFEKALVALGAGVPRMSDMQTLAEVLQKGMGMPPYDSSQVHGLWSADAPPLADECRRAIALLTSDFMKHWTKEFQKRSGALSGNG